MVQDKLNDACRDVMTHLVRLRKNRAVIAYNALENRLCEYRRFFLSLSFSPHDGGALMWQHVADRTGVRPRWRETHKSFQLEAGRPNFNLLHQPQTVPCCWQRICRWRLVKFLPPAARISLCLSPQSYRPAQLSVGWLEKRRKVTSSNTMLQLFTHNQGREERRRNNRTGEWQKGRWCKSR